MTLADTPFAYALAVTLFHFLWEGALIALALAGALYLFRTDSARLRYGLACTAMFAMLATFGLTLALTWPHPNGTVMVHTENTRRLGPILPLVLPLRTVDVDRDAPPHLQWIVPLWMLGVSLFGLRSLIGWAGAQRLRTIGVCAAPDFWRERVQELAGRIQLSRPVVLLESCLADAPAVVGFLRPVILTPAGLLTGLPAEQLECILIHELAHIRRYDYLVNLLQSLAEDLLFYHPAVWWVSAVMRAERENCCDDVVVAAQGDARGLAAALAALENYRWTAREAALVAANGGHLMNRVRRLLEGRETARATAAPVFFAGLLLACAALSMTAAKSEPVQAPKAPQAPVFAMTDPPAVVPVVKAPAKRRPPVLIAQAPSSPLTAPIAIPKVYNGARKTFYFYRMDDPRAFQQAQTDQARQQLLRELTIPGAYRKWLNEEVVYIINDEERKAFRQLQTDEERQRFIDQFWLRRDPSPGTDANEYKDEYYRRIAYADQRFSDKGIPGWKTDRGRIYIMFGPPDEIDSHSTGGAYQRPPEQGGGTTTTFPFERWTYRFLEGIGNNVSLEFVDTTGTGDYHMTMDPAEKDRLLNVPGAGFDPQWFRRQQ